jgi:hypothetical protein
MQKLQSILTKTFSIVNMATVANVIKLFTGVSYAFSNVCGQAPALPANIRLGSKGLPGQML